MNAPTTAIEATNRVHQPTLFGVLSALVMTDKDKNLNGSFLQIRCVQNRQLRHITFTLSGAKYPLRGNIQSPTFSFTFSKL